jgi:hypothetical protein
MTSSWGVGSNMICPVEIAGDLSAFLAARVGDHAKHGVLLEGRDGAGDSCRNRSVKWAN